MSEFSKGFIVQRRDGKSLRDPLQAGTSWVYGSLLMSWILGLLPFANWPFVPDFLLMTLVFWMIWQPRLIFYWLIFLLGLLVDTDTGAIFGQHALGYLTVVFCADCLRVRLQWLSSVGQAICLLPAFILMPLLQMAESFCLGENLIDWGWFTQTLMAVILWPMWSWLLSRRFIPERQ